MPVAQGQSSERIWRQVPPHIDDAHSICELALKRLRADILSARLAPGSKLAIRLLTATYQIGISPLRDALAQLSGDGLVILEAQRGFRVSPVSRKDLRDVAHARKFAELSALELSIGRMDDAWRKRVRAAYGDFCQVKQRVGDSKPISEDWEERHRRLHFALLSACDSPILMRFCSQMHDRFDRYRRIALPTRSYMGGVVDDHEFIMEAALSGNKADAMSLLARHIDDTLALIEEYFRPPEG